MTTGPVTAGPVTTEPMTARPMTAEPMTAEPDQQAAADEEDPFSAPGPAAARPTTFTRGATYEDDDEDADEALAALDRALFRVDSVLRTQQQKDPAQAPQPGAVLDETDELDEADEGVGARVEDAPGGLPDAILGWHQRPESGQSRAESESEASSASTAAELGVEMADEREDPIEVAPEIVDPDDPGYEPDEPDDPDRPG